MTDGLPASETMLPDTNQEASIILCCPFGCPVGRRLQIVDRDLVFFKVGNPLKVLHDSFELVIPRDDGLGVDGRYGEVGE